jgi:hypothetical protein
MGTDHDDLAILLDMSRPEHEGRGTVEVSVALDV